MVKRRIYYLALLVWSVIYITGILIAPLAPNRFNLTTTKTHFLQLTISLPIVLIWLAATYGVERFKSYTQAIKKHNDGRALDQVATGLTILVISVMSNGLSSVLRPWALRDGWIEAFTICFNYLQVILPLIAFYIMHKGSTRLRVLAIRKKESGIAWWPVLLMLSLIGIVYLRVLLGYPYNNSTPDPAKYSSFYLPDWLIVSTLALPYLIGWGLGIKAAMNIVAYRRYVKGIIYKAALNRFVLGIFLVIGFAIILQLLVAFSTYFARASLSSILLVVYLIILLYSLGFLVIASGSKKLKAIERVGQ